MIVLSLNRLSNSKTGRRGGNDAYLAAFAVTENLTVVTFDGGFKQYVDSGYILLE